MPTPELSSYRATRTQLLVNPGSPDRITRKEWKTLAAHGTHPEVLAEMLADAESPAFASVRQRILDFVATRQGHSQGGTATGTTPLQARGRNPVFLHASGRLTQDPAGALPQTLAELGSTLYRAAAWIERGFDARSSRFSRITGLTLEGKRNLFAQVQGALAADLSGLNPDQRRQLSASAGTLYIELFKSLTAQPASASLHGEIFSALEALVSHPETPATTSHILIARMQDSGFVKGLTTAQRARNAEILKRISPEAPMDYAEWQRQAAQNGKVVLNISHASGMGEGFLEGYALALEGDTHLGIDGQGFTRVSGTPRGPAHYRKVVQPGEGNVWGVPFEVNIYLRGYASDMYAPMADENIHWVSYGGHSSFGKNKLSSLESAPDARGYKMIVSDLCCGADGIDAEFARYPGIQNLTSHASTYFGTSEHPEYGQIAPRSEGFDMMMTLLDGVMQKKGWAGIESDLGQRAHWWGHPTSNNWITPNAWRRRMRELDSDNDGSSDLIDALPRYNTFDVAADTSAEFDLQIPPTPADEIRGERAFLATRALNTALNYNRELSRASNQRDVVGAPDGIFFQAEAGQREYVRFANVEVDGEKVVSVQFSSALADMSVEALRAVVFYEYVQWLVADGRLQLERDEAVYMGLVFAAGSLNYDRGWRDDDIYRGLARLYDIPAAVTLSHVQDARRKAENGPHHDYMGNADVVRTALDELGDAVRAELRKATVGVPSVAVGGNVA